MKLSLSAVMLTFLFHHILLSVQYYYWCSHSFLASNSISSCIDLKPESNKAVQYIALYLLYILDCTTSFNLFSSEEIMLKEHVAFTFFTNIKQNRSLTTPVDSNLQDNSLCLCFPKLLQVITFCDVTTLWFSSG